MSDREIWHELVLAGVGGRTIAEAKERLEYTEALQWFEYVRRRGSLNVGRRVENGVALLAFLYMKTKGARVEMQDFLPHEDKPEASVDDVLKAFGFDKGNEFVTKQG